MLIEDNLGDIRLLEVLLTEARPDKYKITPAMTLREGLRLLKNNNFDVVVTDIGLPDADGLNVVKNIQKLDSSIPIVVQSGRMYDEDFAMQVVQFGAQDYLVKGEGHGHLISRVLEYSIERKRSLENLSYIANYDSLTGLANRLLFRERLDRALIRSDRNKSMVALFVIDLDRFKNINDTLGHDVGDELLVKVASRFSGCTRDGDTIARLGGDEFTIIMEDIKSHEDTLVIVEKILNSTKKPFNLSLNEVYITPSIGISIYPTDDLNANSLLKNADAAMYRAKDNGRNGYCFYTSNINKQMLKNLNLESKLRHAIKKKEFILHYQPKFNIDTKEIVGAEALVRWNSVEEGMVMPKVFIPLAEESGLIGPITDWIVTEACKQNSEWQKQGFKPIRMSINISPRQFNQENISGRILNQILLADVAPQYVELEITEGALIENVIKSNEMLRELKNKGIHLSIDDFGTGYSSLNYLKKFPLNTLKIDQSFIRDILSDEDDAAIVLAIIAMAKSLRLNVIAEGVETAEQLDFLKTNGCTDAQGFFLGKPVPAEEFSQFFKKAKKQHIN
ncbi:MAG: EAL domain-containing protein [Gammaproteobacteria bacterium]